MGMGLVWKGPYSCKKEIVSWNDGREFQAVEYHVEFIAWVLLLLLLPKPCADLPTLLRRAIAAAS